MQVVLYEEAAAFVVKYSQGEWPDQQVKVPGQRTFHQVKSMSFALSGEMKVRC